MKSVDAKVSVSKRHFAIDAKRLYLPVKLTTKCPKCGEEVMRDLEKTYLSYPKLNAPIQFWIMHTNADGEECGDFFVEIQLGLTVEVVK